MERYRSGHNGADSKSVCAHAHEGSNPSLSATLSLKSPILGSFSFNFARFSTFIPHFQEKRLLQPFGCLSVFCKAVQGNCKAGQKHPVFRDG